MAEGELLASRYEVLLTVSEGRRATVLQAIDRVHDRPVALKVYPVGEDREALLAEARVLMAMAPHPGLPVVRGDLFTDDGARYIVVLNWIDGIDLQQLLEDEGDPGLPMEDVIADLAQVADALDHLHAHMPPIVHGDVKPANLVRTPAGQVVLVDFDIAGADAGSGRVGTRGFVAPEVAAGDKPGPAADVFGLAATAVALLDGRPPDEALPSYPGIEPALKADVARVLRAGIASDPARRPRSAGRLVTNLRRAGRTELPSGVVALLAAEVAGAAHLWRVDPDEMRAAMTRLRDVRDEVVDLRGGRVVSSMNEGDRTIAVFREAAGGALAALDLHDRLAAELFPPDFDVRLRVAVTVGDAELSDGVYRGAVVDQVLGLRTMAGPGTTLTSEATAELLLDLVGRDASIVPLGQPTGSILPCGSCVFGLTRPGAEHSARVATHSSTAVPGPAPSARPPLPAAPVVPETSRRAVVGDALQHPSVLVPLAGGGLALIYLLVLSGEIGGRTPALVVVVGALLAAAATFRSQYLRGEAVRRRVADDAERARARARNLAVTSERVASGFSALDSDVGASGLALLDGLTAEFNAILELIERHEARSPANLSALLPDLADATYRRGVSALSDAFDLLELAGGAEHRRLAAELDGVEDRLATDTYLDERERQRDEQRRDSRRQRLRHHEEVGRRASELLFEAERCSTALAEARAELASSHTGDIQVDVDTVVHSLQATISHVREVQEELRRLGE